MPRRRRRVKLVQPGLQLRLILVFLSIAVVAALVETILINWSLMRASERMPHDGPLLLAALPRMMTLDLALTLALMVPLMFAVGLAVTHRIAGPVYRFETHLGQVLRGEDPGPCRIRKRDELHELCNLIDQTTVPLRKAAAASAERDASEAAA